MLVVSLVLMELLVARSVKKFKLIVLLYGWYFFYVDPRILFDRVPLVSVVPLAQLDLRELPVSLETLVLLVHLDPRWVMQHISFRG